MNGKEPTVLNTNVEITEELIYTAKRALGIALPRIDPLAQEKIFCAVNLALEQCEFALRLMKRNNAVTNIHLLRLSQMDGKTKASEGRESPVMSPVVCGHQFETRMWQGELTDNAFCTLEKGHEGSHVS